MAEVFVSATKQSACLLIKLPLECRGLILSDCHLSINEAKRDLKLKHRHFVAIVFLFFVRITSDVIRFFCLLSYHRVRQCFEN